MKRESTGLARARHRAGYTQYKAARALKISPEHLCRVERGWVPATKIILTRIARLYGLRLETVTMHYKASRKRQLLDSVRRARGGVAAA